MQCYACSVLHSTHCNAVYNTWKVTDKFAPIIIGQVQLTQTVCVGRHAANRGQYAAAHALTSRLLEADPYAMQVLDPCNVDFL
jgi:hypothetical protein